MFGWVGASYFFYVCVWLCLDAASGRLGFVAGDPPMAVAWWAGVLVVFAVFFMEIVFYACTEAIRGDG